MTQKMGGWEENWKAKEGGRRIPQNEYTITTKCTYGETGQQIARLTMHLNLSFDSCSAQEYPSLQR